MDEHTHTAFFTPGGTLHSDAPCYVERQADRDVLAGLLAGEFCYVLTSRQMGKSSLMVRTVASLERRGVRPVVLDLAALGLNVTAEQWYDGLAVRIGRQLRIEDEVEDFWQDHQRLGPCQRWFEMLRETALARGKAASPEHPAAPVRDGNVVVFIDELDVVRSLPFRTDEFFAAIRECYNRRARDPELNRLTFCLLGVAAPYELMADPRMTPFNIGRRIALADFTAAEADALVRGLRQPASRSAPLDAARLFERTMYWTHGHPYLTQGLLRAIATRAELSDAGREESLVDRVCEETYLSPRARESDDNLLYVRERLLRSEADLNAVLERYEQICQGEPVPDQETDPRVNALMLSGIARVERQRLVVRNRIYARVFDREWAAGQRVIAELEKPDGERLRIRGNVSLGRTDANDVVLPDIKVSRRHALIQSQGNNELWLVDLGSRNGTLLNGVPVTRAVLLRDRDRIGVGPFQLVFHQPNAPRIAPDDLTTIERLNKTVVG